MPALRHVKLRKVRLTLPGVDAADVPDSQAPGYAVITLARPPVNALSSDVLRELRHALAFVDVAADIYGALLDSECEETFCAGLDLKELAALAAAARSPLRHAAHAHHHHHHHHQPPSAASLAQSSLMYDGAAAVFRAFAALSKPLACAVDGHCVAGGFVLACAADYLVVSSTKTFRCGRPAGGVALPSLIPRLLERRCPRHVVRAFTFFGITLTPAELVALHIADEASDAPRDAAARWLETTLCRQLSASSTPASIGTVPQPPSAFAFSKWLWWRDVLDADSPQAIELERHRWIEQAGCRL